MVTTDYIKKVNPPIRKSKKFNDFKFDLPFNQDPYLHRYKLRHVELYADGAEINKLNLPVENGDIFEIYEGKLRGKYILVNQECDLMVRTNEESKGKKLSFVLQEIGREINTTGSKAYDADIQKCVVIMKDELEKAKEQVLNVL